MTTSRRYRIAGLLVAATLVGGAGAWQLAFADKPDVPTGQPVRYHPDSGLSEKQIRENQARAFANGQQKAANVVADFNASGVDPRTLERHDAEFSYAPPPASLSDALANTQVAVLGTVTGQSFEFDEFPRNVVTLKVERSLKGDAPAELKIWQFGGPVLSIADDGDGAGGRSELVLTQNASDPLLFAGDRVVLFLDQNDAGFWQSSGGSFAGYYRLDGGKVQALEGNPFGPDVNALSEDAFAARVQLGK